MSAVTAQSTGEGPFQVCIRTGSHSFVMDEPVELGGLDTGPNPFDLLCAALAGCTLMTVKLYASRKGWTLDHFNVDVVHHKGSAPAKDRFEVTLAFGDMTDEQCERLLYIAQRCPTHLLLERGADIPTTIVEE